MIHNNNVHHHQSKAATNKPSPSLPYTTTTQEAIDRYSFVPVFASTEGIQGSSSSSSSAAPHNNNEEHQQQQQQPLITLTKPSKGQVPWCCIECDSETFGHKCTCCGRPRETGALRVFVGKLNREGSAESCNAMLQTLCSAATKLSGPVLHVEPHTHASNGRGKGCTWVYVRSAKDVKTIVDALHHRTFVAVHPVSGEVGFVPFPSTCDDAEIENVFQYDHDNRQRFVHYLLHRGRVTAEIPESMQQDVFAKLNGTFLGKHQQRQNNFNQNQDFVPAFSFNKPPVNASHTQQMMNYVNHQTPAYNASMMMSIPSGFQQRINNTQQPQQPSYYNNNNNNNHHHQAPVPTQQQSMSSSAPPIPQQPHPEFATASWFQDEDNNDNDFGCDEEHEQEQEQQQQSTLTGSSCKIVCNNGRRYMWNPY